MINIFIIIISYAYDYFNIFFTVKGKNQADFYRKYAKFLDFFLNIF